MMMFCSDDRCSIPLHTLIADTIESCGGSSYLIKTLNRLGVCSSADTLARFMQCKVQEREKRGPEHECVNNALTIISVDNIDFQHSYARVFCGKQTSSWHGTTVQAVQPKPSVCMHEAGAGLHLGCHEYGASNLPSRLSSSMCYMEEQVNTRQGPLQAHVSNSTQGELTATALTSVSNDNRHSACEAMIPIRVAERKRIFTTRSPCLSPLKAYRSPQLRKRRRARTGTEGATTHVPPTVFPEHLPTQHHHTSENALDLQHFVLNPAEGCALKILKMEMNTYNSLQNHYHTFSDESQSESYQPVLHIQEYMTVISPVQPEKSEVVYIQVLDAVTENKDTIMFDLHSRFLEGLGNKFLVLAADAKLYQMISSVKYEYGEELEWLLPFPGDWHNIMLKNYQRAVMKPYFDMGLKELAHASGYPVAAIHNCSQFKRTHHFLMEVWQAIYQVMLQRFIDSEADVRSESAFHINKVIKSASLHVKSNKHDFETRLASLR